MRSQQERTFSSVLTILVLQGQLQRTQQNEVSMNLRQENEIQTTQELEYSKKQAAQCAASSQEVCQQMVSELENNKNFYQTTTPMAAVRWVGEVDETLQLAVSFSQKKSTSWWLGTRIPRLQNPSRVSNLKKSVLKARKGCCCLADRLLSRSIHFPHKQRRSRRNYWADGVAQC